MNKPANQPLNEAQLIALIEDQLDASAAARLRAELADKPELLRQIEGMRADRQLVRALPEPELSRDLLEALEPALARPMLLAPLTASEYRKRHAHARRPRFARLALAAAFLLVIFAGVWAATSGLLTDGGLLGPNDGDALASRTPGEGMLDQRTRRNSAGDLDAALQDEMMAAADAVPPFDRVTVHHLPPPADVRAELARPRMMGVDPQAVAAAAAASDQSEAPQLVVAPFALVIETDDLDHALELLKRPVDPAQATLSLVRNITEDEVLEYGRMLAQRNAANKRLSAPVTAGTPLPDAADRSGPAANTPIHAPGVTAGLVPGTLGEQLAGDPQRAASVEDQLRLSQAGAQYALTVPADRVAEALMAVNLATGQMTSLRTLETLNAEPVAKAIRPASLELMWIEQLSQIRASLEALDLAQARDIVIPVRIDVRESRKRN